MNLEAFFPFELKQASEPANPPMGADQPPKEIADRLRASLSNTGAILTEAYSHSDYGWAFEISDGKVSVWCMLQQSDSLLLICKVFGAWKHKLLAREPEVVFARVTKRIDETLRSWPDVVYGGVKSRADFERGAS